MTSADPLDSAFKALADPTRRLVLDRLRAEDGQTLTQLSERVEMARQSLTQHVDLLVDAGLVTVVRRGRERLHYLNPVPIQEIGERWVAAYEVSRLTILSAIKQRAEENDMTETAAPAIPDYVYVTYIRAAPEQVWEALTDADVTALYWGHSNESDWQVGSPWVHRRVDGSDVVDVAGTVLASEPPTRLVITFEDSEEERAHGPSEVEFLIERYQETTRLTVTHSNLPNAEMLQGISQGWSAVLANLKSLLETGDVLWAELWVKPEGGQA